MTGGIDPRLVKAGDTVTLERDGGRLPNQKVIVVSETVSGLGTLILKGGIEVKVDGPDAWTITEHKPAPGSEPYLIEWAVEVDTIGTKEVYDREAEARAVARKGDLRLFRIEWVEVEK